METPRTAQQEKNLVAMTSLLAALAITTFKIIVGLASGSLGILAEAAHSGLDLMAAGMTCWAIRSASKPPDAKHHFGHGKIENLSALFETLLLVATCVWIFYGAINRLVSQSVDVEIGYGSFAVMIASIAVDYSRSRALSRAAKKHNSQALEADALHFSTDVWSSLAVIGGLIAVTVAQRVPALKWLENGDAVAALLVAIIALVVTLRLGLRTVQSLADAAPPGMLEKVKQAALSVDGILDCHEIRLRTAGSTVLADIHVGMDGRKPLQEVHDLLDRVEEAIRVVIPEADVTLHPEPVTVAADNASPTV